MLNGIRDNSRLDNFISFIQNCKTKVIYIKNEVQQGRVRGLNVALGAIAQVVPQMFFRIGLVFRAQLDKGIQVAEKAVAGHSEGGHSGVEAAEIAGLILSPVAVGAAIGGIVHAIKDWISFENETTMAGRAAKVCRFVAENFFLGAMTLNFVEKVCALTAQAVGAVPILNVASSFLILPSTFIAGIADSLSLYELHSQKFHKKERLERREFWHTLAIKKSNNTIKSKFNEEEKQKINKIAYQYKLKNVKNEKNIQKYENKKTKLENKKTKLENHKNAKILQLKKRGFLWSKMDEFNLWKINKKILECDTKTKFNRLKLKYLTNKKDRIDEKIVLIKEGGYTNLLTFKQERMKQKNETKLKFNEEVQHALDSNEGASSIKKYYEKKLERLEESYDGSRYLHKKIANTKKNIELFEKLANTNTKNLGFFSKRKIEATKSKISLKIEKKIDYNQLSLKYIDKNFVILLGHRKKITHIELKNINREMIKAAVSLATSALLFTVSAASTIALSLLTFGAFAAAAVPTAPFIALGVLSVSIALTRVFTYLFLTPLKAPILKDLPAAAP